MDSVGKWLGYLAAAAVIGGLIVLAVSLAGTVWRRLSGRVEPASSPRMPPTEKFLFYGVFKVLVSILAAAPATVLMGMAFSHLHKGKDILDDFSAALSFLAYAIYFVIPAVFAYFYIQMGRRWRQAASVAAVLIGVTVIYWLVAIAFRPDQRNVLFIVAFLTPYLAGPPLIGRWLRRQPPFAASGPTEPA